MKNQVNTPSEWGGSKGKMRLGNPDPVTKTITTLILHEDGCKEGFYLRVPTSQTKNGYKEVEYNAILFCDAFNTIQKCGKLPSQLLEELCKVEGNYDSFPLRKILEQLIIGCEVLLHEHDYDRHGWEILSNCVDLAKERQNYLENKPYTKSDVYEKLKEEKERLIAERDELLNFLINVMEGEYICKTKGVYQDFKELLTKTFNTKS